MYETPVAGAGEKRRLFGEGCRFGRSPARGTINTHHFDLEIKLEPREVAELQNTAAAFPVVLWGVAGKRVKKTGGGEVGERLGIQAEREAQPGECLSPWRPASFLTVLRVAYLLL